GVGMATEVVGDGEAAVGAAFGRDAAGRGDAPGDEVGGDRSEVVVRQPLARVATGFVPGGAEFAAASDVGDNTGTAALQPELADGVIVVGHRRDAETTIAAEMHRPIARLPGRPGLRVGDPFAA